MSALDWLGERVKGAVNSTVEGFIKIGIWLGIPILIGFLVIFAGEVTLPTWAFALLVAFVAAVVLFVGRRFSDGASAEDLAFLADEIELGEYYSFHLNDILGTLQKVVLGTIPNVTADRFIEDGILEPAREFLMQRQGEDVRLSVLVPDNGNWRMPLAAGYRLESKQRFSLPIVGSFSRYAYETGEIQWSGELTTDPRFTPHPQASRTYHSIISVPIRVGDAVVAVFNVDSTFEHAFPTADFIYVALLGAIISVVSALGERARVASAGNA